MTHVSQRDFQSATEPVRLKGAKLLQFAREVREALDGVVDVIEYHDGDLEAAAKQLTMTTPMPVKDENGAETLQDHVLVEVTPKMLEDYQRAAELMETMFTQENIKALRRVT